MGIHVETMLAVPQLRESFTPRDWEQREARLTQLLTGVPLLLITFTPSGTLTFANRLSEETLGYRAQELIGRSFWDLAAESASQLEATQRRLRCGDVRGCELLMYAKSGEPRLIVWDLLRDVDAAGQVVELIAWGRDVTAQRREERARDQLIREQQEALAARAELLSIAAQELKTPLTLLIGRSQLVQSHLGKRDTSLIDDQYELGRVVEHGLKLNAMIDTLLTILRLEAGQLEMTRVRVDLYGLLGTLLIKLRALLNQHQVELVPPAAPIAVLGEPLLLAQLFEQLLENAVTYSPAGTLIKLRLDTWGLMARVQVQDQGRGMPTGALAGLFEPAAQCQPADPYAHYKMKGGLYIVREVVTLHQGTVDVVSAPGQGSTFTVHLPRVS